MEQLTSFLTRFAVTYDCGTYGASTYNNNDPCQTTTTGTSGGTSGGLAGTGVDVLLPLAIGLVLIISAILILVRMRKKSRKK